MITELENCTLINADCTDLIAGVQCDAIVTDPPYGIGKKMAGGGARKWKKMCEKMQVWDLTAPQHLIDLILEKNLPTIIWGGNYFYLPPSRAYLVWDKLGSMKGRTFAECEMAWCSWDANARTLHLSPPTHAKKEIKIHPTQKPLQVMKWCISWLPIKSGVIFDPFMGSGSTAIAALDAGYKFVGIEKDTQYFNDAVKRIKSYIDEPKLFANDKKVSMQQQKLFEI